MAWFFHPLLFMLATTWVILILARRDFFSRSLRLIAGTGKPYPAAPTPTGTARHTAGDQSRW